MSLYNTPVLSDICTTIPACLPCSKNLVFNSQTLVQTRRTREIDYNLHPKRWLFCFHFEFVRGRFESSTSIHLTPAAVLITLQVGAPQIPRDSFVASNQYVYSDCAGTGAVVVAHGWTARTRKPLATRQADCRNGANEPAVTKT